MDEILMTMRAIDEAKNRPDHDEGDQVLVSASCAGMVVAGVITKDTDEHLRGYAINRKLTRENVLIEIYGLKGSISEKAVRSFLFEDPRL